MDSATARPEATAKELLKSDEGSQPKVLFSLALDLPEDPRLVNFHELELFSGITFRWSEPVSMIRIRMAPVNGRVIIDTSCLRGESLDFPFQIHWNNYQIPAKAIRIEKGVLSFEIGTRICEPTGEQRLTISSKPLNAENGRRQLGLPMSALTVVESAQVGNDAVLSFEKYNQPKNSNWNNPTRAIWSRNVTPTLPIWKVRIPDVSYVHPVKEAQASQVEYPACDQVVVAPCEINSRHGTGLLIQYLVEDFDQVATVNSYHCYNGDRVQSKVHHCLPDYKRMTRQEIYDQIFEWFGKNPPKEAYIVPYFASDFLIATALKDLFKTRTCIHVMDDNCIYGTIAKDIVDEAIEKCDLLLMISPEMRQQYEQRFGKRAYMLPPIVPQQFIPGEVLSGPQTRLAPAPVAPATSDKAPISLWNRIKSWVKKGAPVKTSSGSPQRGILIGNVWDSAWLDMLRQTIRTSGLQIDWFANNPKAVWHNVSQAQLAEDGIHLHDSLWGQDLVEEMRKRPFAIMPTGALTGEGTKESIARLSLPSRVPFMIATAHLPVIVLGSPETAAARFLSRFELGSVVNYDGAALRTAVNELMQSERQSSIRQSAHQLAAKFSNQGIEPWLWQSLKAGSPADERFENLFESLPGEFAHYFDSEPPEAVHWSFRDTWKLIHRVKLQGFTPDTVIDVGASTGVWSWTASTIFPNAKYVLVDPLMRRYAESSRKYYLSKIKSHQFMDVALSDQSGEMEMLVSNDLYGSSLLSVNEKMRKTEVAKVEVLTLDELSRRCGVGGRTLLKIDVQFAEHLVINGGLDFIRRHVDVIILELTIHRAHVQAKTYREMLDMMDQLGFDVIDEMEGWRDPKTGLLEQKDTVFIRKERHPMLQAA